MTLLIDSIYAFGIKHRVHIIRVFQLVYFLLVGVVIADATIVSQDVALDTFYSFGKTLGEAAVISFVLLLIPGIARRFGFKHKLISLVMIFRRYIGILMFLLVLAHFALLRMIPISRQYMAIPAAPVVFELLGTLSLVLLFPLFLTSNDWSIKKMKAWWYKLHRLVYIIMWTVLLHLGLQSLSIWTVLMGSIVLLECMGIMIQWIRTRTKKEVT